MTGENHGNSGFCRWKSKRTTSLGDGNGKGERSPHSFFKYNSPLFRNRRRTCKNDPVCFLWIYLYLHFSHPLSYFPFYKYLVTMQSDNPFDDGAPVVSVFHFSRFSFGSSLSFFLGSSRRRRFFCSGSCCQQVSRLAFALTPLGLTLLLSRLLMSPLCLFRELSEPSVGSTPSPVSSSLSSRSSTLSAVWSTLSVLIWLPSFWTPTPSTSVSRCSFWSSSSRDSASLSVTTTDSSSVILVELFTSFCMFCCWLVMP